MRERQEETPFTETGSVISSTSEFITPERAKEILETMAFGRQREIREKVVSEYAQAMKDGRFVQGTAIVVGICDDKHALLDGQHRLHAIVKSRVSQFLVIVTHAVTEDAMLGWLYSRLDIGKRRSPNERVRGLGLDEELFMSLRDATSLRGAVQYIHTGFVRAGGRMTLNDEDSVAGMRLYASQMRSVLRILRGTPRATQGFFTRSATLGPMIVTLRFPVFDKKTGANLSDDFWGGTVGDNGLVVGDPRKAALNHLRISTMSAQRQNRSIRQVFDTGVSSRILVQCYNAFVQGRELRAPRNGVYSGDVHVFGAPESDHWLLP